MAGGPGVRTSGVNAGGVARRTVTPRGTSVPETDVAVSDRTARALGVAAGDTIAIAPAPGGPWRSVRIAQVYRPRLYPTEVADRDADVRLHLPDLQRLLGAGDAVDSVVVRLRDPARAGRVAADLNAMGLGIGAYTSTGLARRNSASFEVVARFHRAIGAVAVLASSVFLVTIMTLRGEEVRREIGMMRLMGARNRTIAAAVLAVASAVAAAGSLAGIGLGYLLAFAINDYYRRFFDTDLLFAQVTGRLVADAAGLSIVLGVAAGVLTVWRLLRRRPLDQMGR